MHLVQDFVLLKKFWQLPLDACETCKYFPLGQEVKASLPAR